MNIYKSIGRNRYRVFDTENAELIAECNIKNQMQPLHHSHEINDYEFLEKYFDLDHPIFDDFTNSFYWTIKL